MGEHVNIFGEPLTLDEASKRGKHYVKPNGYAARPGSGPEGETCKTCQHLTYRRFTKSHPKCGLNQANWTNGRGSDVLVRSPACQLWEAKEQANND